MAALDVSTFLVSGRHAFRSAGLNLLLIASFPGWLNTVVHALHLFRLHTKLRRLGVLFNLSTVSKSHCLAVTYDSGSGLRAFLETFHFYSPTL